jgi:hypothetical protein
VEIVIHRVNTIAGLRQIPEKYGCEIDIRAEGSRLILNHEPFETGDYLTDYLDEYDHGLLILNIKEAGIEESVLQEVRSRGIPRHFLLDVEFPYIYRAARAGERAIAMRYSEDEAIETVLGYEGKVDWVWIDTNTRLPIDRDIAVKLNGFQTCLVCPERWGRPDDIKTYRAQVKETGFRLDAVMTALEYVPDWESP